MAGGLEVADVFRRHGPAFRAARSEHLNRDQRRVMGAIEACRTRSTRRACPPLRRLRPHRDRLQFLPQSSLPQMPGSGSGSLGRRTAGGTAARSLFPRGLHPAGAGRRHGVPEQGGGLRHPVPHCRRDAARHRGRPAPHLGAEIGGVAVLHSLGQAMQHHPHVHCIVPGGGLSPDRTRWIAGPPGFFLSVKVLGRLFRRLFLERLAAAFADGGPRFFGDLTPLAAPRAFAAHCAALRRIDWVVYAKSALRRPQAGAGLSRPLHPSRRHRQQPPRRHDRRRRQLPLEGRPRQESRRKVMTVDAGEFMRRFLLHVLPSGFHRIRHFGFLANGHRAARLALCRQLLAQPVADRQGERDFEPDDHRCAPPCQHKPEPDVCRCCGSFSSIMSTLPRAPPHPAPAR